MLRGWLFLIVSCEFARPWLIVLVITFLLMWFRSFIVDWSVLLVGWFLSIRFVVWCV